MTNKAAFLNGITLEKPPYTFKWVLDLENIQNVKFLHLQVKKKNRKQTNIEFDSATFLNGFLLNKIILKYGKIKNDQKFTLLTFEAMMDLYTLDKLRDYFKQDFDGAKTYSKNHPPYLIRLHKRKKSGYLIIKNQIYKVDN